LKHSLYFLVRYVPNVATGQFVNVGLFLYCPHAQFLDCLFTDDFREVQRFHPQADLEFLGELQGHFEREIAEHEKDLPGYIRGMQESYSNLIQISEPRACVVDDFQATLPRLLETYVGARAAGPPKLDTRMRIKQRLVDALERHGVTAHTGFEKDIPASQWTDPADTFTFDFGYKPVHPGLGVRLMHVASLLRDGDVAAALRSKFEAVLKQCPARLSVFHEDVADPSDALVRSSQQALESTHIMLVPVGWFDEFARWARWELQM
jgi:hypothetical protein